MTRSRGPAALLAGCLFLLAGCSRPEMVPSTAQQPKQDRRIDELFRERAHDGAPVNYAISPGDTLRLKVQQMDELTGERRVAEQGTITLPLLGPFAIAGLTERQAAEKLRGALSEFVKEPQVSVAVAEIHGSQVSVMGAVARPGVYPIRGLDRTIADLITQAGGMTKDAGTAVYFSPSTGSQDVASRRETAANLGLDASAPLLAGAQPAIMIDLTPLYQGRNVQDLTLPVRAGDMIVVSASGEIFVEGWVNHPGAFKLNRGMTITQAISAAGGVHFGGSDGKITLQRKTPTGESKSYSVDYESVASGGATDIPLENGDHIEVGPSPAKAASWGLYSFVKSIFSFGISGSAPSVGAK